VRSVVRRDWGLRPSVDHQLVDRLLAIGAIAAPVATVFLAWLLERRDRRRDQARQKLEIHETRLDRHAVEIRHTQKQTSVEPFYRDSESEL